MALHHGLASINTCLKTYVCHIFCNRPGPSPWGSWHGRALLPVVSLLSSGANEHTWRQMVLHLGAESPGGRYGFQSISFAQAASVNYSGSC